MEDESSSRGFKVEDRRRFSATGEPRSENESTDPVAAKPAAEAPSPEPPPRESASERSSAPPLSEMTFSTFIIGLSTQALVLLGEMADPSSQATQADLVGAKQLIDILGLLQAKTQGNLDEAERGLLDSALYDLRMKYVQRTRAR